MKTQKYNKISNLWVYESFKKLHITKLYYESSKKHTKTLYSKTYETQNLYTAKTRYIHGILKFFDVFKYTKFVLFNKQNLFFKGNQSNDEHQEAHTCRQQLFTSPILKSKPHALHSKQVEHMPWLRSVRLS